MKQGACKLWATTAFHNLYTVPTEERARAARGHVLQVRVVPSDGHGLRAEQQGWHFSPRYLVILVIFGIFCSSIDETPHGPCRVRSSLLTLS
jgi:hypothetical protein